MEPTTLSGVEYNNVGKSLGMKLRFLKIEVVKIFLSIELLPEKFFLFSRRFDGNFGQEFLGVQERLIEKLVPG